MSDKQTTSFPLRSFFYLDDDTVDDFLSQIEGGISEGTYTAKLTETGAKSGKFNAGFYGLGAGVSGDKSSVAETSQVIRETPTWRFFRLYNLLNEHTQFLSQFNQSKYDEIPVGKIVKLRARLQRTSWEHLIEELESAANFANLGKKMGLYDPTQDPSFQQMMDVLPNLKETTTPEETLIIATIAAAPAFKFILKLKDEKLQRRKNALETEALILGKVERKLEKNDKPIDIFRLLPRLAGLQKLNRQQLRQLQKQNSTNTQYDISVKYPAIELLPIAIYL